MPGAAIPVRIGQCWGRNNSRWLKTVWTPHSTFHAQTGILTKLKLLSQRSDTLSDWAQVIATLRPFSCEHFPTAVSHTSFCLLHGQKQWASHEHVLSITSHLFRMASSRLSIRQESTDMKNESCSFARTHSQITLCCGHLRWYPSVWNNLELETEITGLSSEALIPSFSSRPVHHLRLPLGDGVCQ